MAKRIDPVQDALATTRVRLVEEREAVQVCVNNHWIESAERARRNVKYYESLIEILEWRIKSNAEKAAARKEKTYYIKIAR